MQRSQYWNSGNDFGIGTATTTDGRKGSTTAALEEDAIVVVVVVIEVHLGVVVGVVVVVVVSCELVVSAEYFNLWEKVAFAALSIC